MHLRTLGELALPGAAVTQPKPLLLLAYLALEGPQGRAFLAELFYGGSRARANLSVLLSRLRKGAPDSIRSDGTRVVTDLGSDVAELLGRLDAGRHDEALALYRGRFLGGVELPRVGVELEEWIYGTREFLASRVQAAQLVLAEIDAAAGRYERAAERAESAFRLAHAVPETDTLRRLHMLLLAGGNPHASAARADAELVAFSLAGSPEEARERLRERLEPAAPAASSNLPVPGTSFVGRDLELAAIADLLAENRLVTLVGPGGVGKSRLALRAAQQQLRQGLAPDGVTFVPLETVAAPDQIPRALAEALRFDLHGPVHPLEQIAERIGDRRILLLLDNCEHLLGGAPLVARLLRRCPGLRILTTSRERLHLHDEWLYPVEGLAYPTDPGLAPEAARRFDAVQLFLARARQAAPAFALGQDDLPAVIALCERTAGLPLALELAATWVRALPVAELAGELERDLDLLASPNVDVDARHRTIRASFEHSWRLLGERERQVFRRLAVFRGGFRRAMAAAVAGATLPLLARLVDASLLRMAPSGRYDRHPLLYQWGLEKLAERPAEEAAAREAHAETVLSFFADQEEALVRDRAVQAIAAMTEELENATAAWDWAVERGRFDLLRSAAWMLAGFALHTSRFGVGIDLLGRAVAAARAAEADDLTIGTLLCSWGWVLAWSGGDGEVLGRAMAAAEEGMALLPERHDTMNAIGLGNEAVAWALGQQGRFDEAVPYAEHQLATATAVGHRMWTALGHKILGIVALWLGDLPLARERLERAVAIERREGFEFNQLAGLDFLGRVYLELGLLGEADALYHEGLELARLRRHQRMVVLYALGLGRVAYRREAFADAEGWYREAWEQAKLRDARPFEPDIFESLAEVAEAQGRTQEAEGYRDRRRALVAD